VVGVDYPRRIVEDHTATSKGNMGRMAEAYKRHKEGVAKSGARAGGGGVSNKKRKPKGGGGGGGEGLFFMGGVGFVVKNW